jgi:hypothetical protein
LKNEGIEERNPNMNNSMNKRYTIELLSNIFASLYTNNRISNRRNPNLDTIDNITSQVKK